MSDLPPLDKVILPLVIEIEAMRRGGSIEKQKPHKLFLLLAVLDLYDQELLTENRIYFDQQLQRNFEKYFRLYAKSDDWCQPGPPFFHLRSSSFWKHKIKPGQETVYAKITTSGGGTRRIHENIEYAYFDDYTFFILSKAKQRAELREFILTLIRGANDMNNPDRLPTVFHESFALSRPSITQIINSLSVSPGKIDLKSKEKREDYLREQTQLGVNYVRAMPEYAKGAGLVSFTYEPTHFGKTIQIKDPSLEQLCTQWLMHYFLSAPHGPGPTFWHEIVSSRFRNGDEFTQEEIANEIGRIYARDKGKPLSTGSATSTANAFLGTYIKSDGLGKLGLLEETSDNHYRVIETDVPPRWAVAIAVLDYWQVHFQQQVTVNLTSLTTESGLASLFMISRSRLDMILGEMREAGLVELFRFAPPYQVALLDSDPEPIFQRMYSHG
jgi:hypothetical protein